MALGEYLGAGSGITKLLWHLNGNANDDSGNGNNGTRGGTPAYATGKFGQCASFNGSSSYIQGTISNPTSRGTNSGTISVWFRHSSTNRASEEGLFQIQETGSYGHYMLWINNNGTGIISMRGGGDSNSYFTPSYTFGKETRYNIIFVRRTNGDDIYVNGNLIGTRSITGNFVNTGTTFRIGAGTNAGNLFFNGLIDEVIVDSSPRDAVKVKKYYTYTKGRFGIV